MNDSDNTFATMHSHFATSVDHLRQAAVLQAGLRSHLTHPTVQDSVAGLITARQVIESHLASLKLAASVHSSQDLLGGQVLVEQQARLNRAMVAMHRALRKAGEIAETPVDLSDDPVITADGKVTDAEHSAVTTPSNVARDENSKPSSRTRKAAAATTTTKTTPTETSTTRATAVKPTSSTAVSQQRQPLSNANMKQPYQQQQQVPQAYQNTAPNPNDFLPEITVDEMLSIPKYLLKIHPSKLSLGQFNQYIQDLNLVIRARYQLGQFSASKAPRDLRLWQSAIHEDGWDESHQEMIYWTDKDMKMVPQIPDYAWSRFFGVEKPQIKMDAMGRSVVAGLRHLGKLKELRVGGGRGTRFVVLLDETAAMM